MLPKFNYTPQEIAEVTTQIITEMTTVNDYVASLSIEERTFQNVFLKMYTA